MLFEGKYTEEVRKDIAEGEELGINGVPFFLFNGKQAFSGAQKDSVFLKVLDKLWKEGNQQNSKTY